jgi:hypothetical protein
MVLFGQKKPSQKLKGLRPKPQALALSLLAKFNGHEILLKVNQA